MIKINCKGERTVGKANKGNQKSCLPEQQRRTPGQEALYVPERVELRRKIGQRGLLITSYKRLEKRL